MNDTLHDFLNKAAKEFGDHAAIILDEDKTIEVEVIPTGVEIIDQAIGVGGIPKGRITEVFGAEGCGKTSLCLHTIAQAQKMGLNVLFVDAEHALSVSRMRELGVDTKKMVLSQPDSGEQALDVVEMAVRTGDIQLIVVDSVAALTPQVEVEKDMGDSVMGVHARLMSQAMRKLTAPVSKFNVALIFTNQTRSKIGGYGLTETTTGGNALKFYASLRLRMQYTGQIKNSAGERISGKYKMTVVKNKLATPFKEAEFEINQYGIDDTGQVIDALVKAEVLFKSGNWYKRGDTTLASGKQALIEILHEDEDLRTELVQALHNKQTQNKAY